ncbi:MAG: toll/interleukin-1 receptor domain-containing protein [Ruminococcaceae bacterium]|nr:toll/interleukin-1 receptor domain-containing protein [Oscillospiraceae bacterium]
MIFKPKFSHLFFASLGLYIIGGQLYGLFLGFTMGDMAEGALQGLIWGVACGIMFPIVMQLISFLLEIKYRKLRKAIAGERRLICDGSATHNGNGGWMYLTEKGLEFYPHKINLSSDKIIIPLDLIQSTETTQNKLVVKLSADLAYTFHVSQNNRWKTCIDDSRNELPSKNGPDATVPPLDPIAASSHTPSDTPYVFISYGSEDLAFAEATRALLYQNNITTWMAPYDIPAGSKYAYVINDAIESCACMLLLLSANSQASQFVECELERAVSYNKTVVSMHIDNCVLNSGFKFFLGKAQIIPVKTLDANSPAVQKVIQSLAYLVSLP